MPYHAHSLVQTKLRGNRICLCHTFVCLAVSLSTGVGELHYAPELAPETVNRSQSSPLGWNFTCPILSVPHLLSAADGQEDAIVVAFSPGTSWPGPSRYIGPAPSHIDGTATTQCARVIPSRYPTCPRYSTHDEIKARCSGAVHENRSIADYVVGLCCKMIRLAGTTW